MTDPLGYVVAIARDSGLLLPSFAEIYNTPQDAGEELTRLAGILHLPPGEKLRVLELHECQEA